MSDRTQRFDRAHMLGVLRDRTEPFDIVVIGGGATGLGVALDAASRGLSVALIEQGDFAHATSSMSTKLVHGGVRYLQRGDVGLVREALHERSVILRNAPHVAHALEFVVPAYGLWDKPYFGTGMKVYDLLAGRHGIGHSRILSLKHTLERVPMAKREGLRGGVRYYDGQFDDARLALIIGKTAAKHGAVVVNYVRAVGLRRSAKGRIESVEARDVESGEEFVIRAHAVINAGGPFSDAVRTMADKGAKAFIAPSRGSHVVLDRSFLGGGAALLVPKTPDGRVMFAIPFCGATLVGTTDVPMDSPEDPTHATEEEIGQILETAGEYLERKPTRADVRATFAGVRPLVRGDAGSTAKLSREHLVLVDEQARMVSIMGGKWTTYRRMAAETVDRARAFLGSGIGPSRTERIRLHGWTERVSREPLGRYGSDEPRVRELIASDPSMGEVLVTSPAGDLTRGEVEWMRREEMARTTEDVLKRRSRAGVVGEVEAAEVTVGELLGR